MELIRKQVYLPKKLSKRVETVSKETKESFSDIVTEALDDYTKKILTLRKTKKKRRENLLGLIGLINSGVTDGSINHDKELYGS